MAFAFLEKIRRLAGLGGISKPQSDKTQEPEDPNFWVVNFGSQKLDQNGHNQMQRNAVFLFRSAALHVTLCELNGNPAAIQMAREDFNLVRLYCLDVGLDVSKVMYQGYQK